MYISLVYSFNSMSHQLITYITDLIGQKPSHISLLQEAFTHKSYAVEQKKKLSHNQRLEFLGDSIL
ncbi:hypothetical protein KBB05_01690 [Patescibacteria group bacterium]|nr:hypothetical protein [Patescibacteria group bacterium]